MYFLVILFYKANIVKNLKQNIYFFYSIFFFKMEKIVFHNTSEFLRLYLVKSNSK